MRLRSLCSRDAAYSLIVAGLAALVLLPALVQPSHLVYPSWSEFSDLMLIHWPKATLIRESLAQGNGWPLWAPYGLSGQPLAANQLAMLFYPPALLLLAGPLTWALTLFYALHLAWAGIGAYWLARGLGRRAESALLAATILVLSGKLAAHTAIGHASLVPAIAWTPWALAFLHRSLTRRSLTFALLTGVALAAQATTHTYALVYTAYGLAVYAASYLILAPAEGNRGREALRQLPRLAAIAATAALLGAAQLLPLAEMAPYSNRSLSFAEATLLSLSPGQTLAGILFPTAGSGHEYAIYPGLLTLGLAAAAWMGLMAAARSGRIRLQWPAIALSVLIVTGVILALGNYTPFYRLAYTLLPGLRWMRTPARLWFFVTLGLAILAAYGLEAWGEAWRSLRPRPNGQDRRRRAASLLLVAATGCAVTLSLGVMILSHQYGRSAWGLALFGTLSGLLLLWAMRVPDAQSGARRRPKPVFAWLAVALIAADLISFDLSLFRFPSLAEVSAPGREAAEWLASAASQAGPFRTYSPSYSLPQPAAIQAGLQQIDGVEPVHLTRYDQFMAVAGGYDQGAFSVTLPPFPDGLPQEPDDLALPDLRLVGLLNGHYLASALPLEMAGLALRREEGGVLVYENSLALPRAFVVYQAEPMAGTATMDEEMSRLGAIDPERTALVSDGRPLNGSQDPTRAEVTDLSPNRVEVRASLEAPGLLVLSEIWYPGWQAWDNGQAAPIVRADAILRGVYLEAGAHTVEFVYRPWTVQAGLIVSGATALALAGYAAMRLLRRKWQGATAWKVR